MKRNSLAVRVWLTCVNKFMLVLTPGDVVLTGFLVLLT